MDKQLDLTLNSLGINEPYSMEAEQAILGAAIISPETVSLIYLCIISTTKYRIHGSRDISFF